MGHPLKVWRLQLDFRLEHARISYLALLATTTCAALRKESRMQIIEATGLDRKSGGAQWRNLCVDALSWGMFFRQTFAAQTQTLGQANSGRRWKR
jgi:hypothetical protein